MRSRLFRSVSLLSDSDFFFVALVALVPLPVLSWGIMRPGSIPSAQGPILWIGDWILLSKWRSGRTNNWCLNCNLGIPLSSNRLKPGSIRLELLTKRRKTVLSEVRLRISLTHHFLCLMANRSCHRPNRSSSSFSYYTIEVVESKTVVPKLKSKGGFY